MHTGRAVALATLCVVAIGCRRDGSGPSPPVSRVVPSTAPSTTVARVPTLTADPIPRLAPATVHDGLGKIGFTRSEPASAPGFVTTTSKRADATVNTYGKSATDVVKIIAEADKAAAPTVLPAVAAVPLTGSEARRAQTWVRAELKKAVSPTQPRTAKATYGRQPYELLVTTTTATLSIGRLTSD